MRCAATETVHGGRRAQPCETPGAISAPDRAKAPRATARTSSEIGLDRSSRAGRYQLAASDSRPTTASKTDRDTLLIFM